MILGKLNERRASLIRIGGVLAGSAAGLSVHAAPTWAGVADALRSVQAQTRAPLTKAPPQAPTTPPASATSANGRALPSPLDSPPFPGSDWLGTWVIGEPNSAPTHLLQDAVVGHKLDKSRIAFYGYADVSYNGSTSHRNNFPMSYDVIPNTFQLNQAVFRIERAIDTVQTDHADYGFRFTSLYGTDYRFTAAKGYFSSQLFKRNAEYGYDPVEAYGVAYLPKIGQGTVVTAGRYISPPDIEAQLAPQNYLFTHSLMFTVDPYTFTGVTAMVRFTSQFSILAGVHGGNDMAPWEKSSSLNGQLLARYVTKDNNDAFWGGVNSLGHGYYHDEHDNLQQVVGTWGHRFNGKLHMMTEAYYMWQFDALKGGSVINGPSQPFAGSGAGALIPGRSDSTGLVNYFEIKTSSKDYVTIRNDFLDDYQGQRTGFATAYSSHTLGYSRTLSPLLTFRPEVRYEHAYASGITPYDNGTRKDQWSIAADIILKF